MRIEAVVFDLDDTLYDEQEFVRSGFRAVAAGAAQSFGVEQEGFYRELLAVLASHGRGKVFDVALERFGAYAPERVARLVQCYRAHAPAIRVFAEAPAVLAALRQTGRRLALITDGLAPVQRSKIRTLELEERMDMVICTDELGAGCSKPHPAAFERVLRDLEVTSERSACIGDDETRDFKAPNDLGMVTIRVMPPPWGLAATRVAPDASYRARFTAQCLSQTLKFLGEP